MSNGKDMIIHFESFGEDINVKVDLFNYATKADLKNATGVDAPSFAKKN